MSGEGVSDKWILVEWQRGGRDVVCVKSIIEPEDREPEIGEILLLYRKGEPASGTLIARARERVTLEAMKVKEETGPNEEQQKEDEEPDVFCSSASSWTPSDDDGQSDDSDVEQKKKTLERYKRQYTNSSNKKVLTSSNKANAVLNETNQSAKTSKKTNAAILNATNQNGETSNKANAVDNVTIQSSEISNKRNAVLNVTNRKRSNNESVENQRRDSAQKPNSLSRLILDRPNIPKRVKRAFSAIMKTYDEMFKFVEDLQKPTEIHLKNYPTYKCQSSNTPTTCYKKKKATLKKGTIPNDDIPSEHNRSVHEEFDRSHDNVLISNKYSKVAVKPEPVLEPEDDPKQEWVPIGSGKTLIQKEKFKKINWKSYTVATRALLIAVFPRKVLATHSLTGKCSPAFMNKPAKMCLDPKKVSDVILEVMDRFKVRENLVRSCITTKCADEAKMMKQRNQKANNDKN